MKSTKTTLLATLALGALLIGGSSLYAQESTNTPPPGGPPGGMRPGRGPNIEMLTTNLSLTTNQIPQVKAVLEEQRTKMMELRNETDQDARRSKMQELRAETTAKMKEILTPEQFEKYEKMSKRRNGPPGERPNQPPSDSKPTGD